MFLKFSWQEKKTFFDRPNRVWELIADVTNLGQASIGDVCHSNIWGAHASFFVFGELILSLFQEKSSVSES